MRRSDYVSVFMGTDGVGNAIVGPQTPHGMVKLSPQTQSLPNTGYDYADDKILGFAHTHLEGVGGSGGRGHIMLMPATGPFTAEEREYLSPYSHEKEKGSAGYYAVELLRYGVYAELAATQCCSIFRLTYPENPLSRLYIDVSHTLCKYGMAVDGHVEQTGPAEFRGFNFAPIRGERSCRVQTYFCVRLSKAPEGVTFWEDGEEKPGASSAKGRKIGASPEFSTGSGEVVYVKTGISYIGEEQAAANLDAQIPGWDFDGVVEACKAEWDEALSAVDVDALCETDERIFYSDLYRSLNVPVDYTEANGKFFLGADGSKRVIDAGGRRYYADLYAMWDTFRATNPLHQLVDPERQDDVAWSIMENYRVAGKLPMAPAPTYGLEPCMIGHHSASILTESYMKKRRNFDFETAFHAMKEATTRTDIGSEGVPKEYAERGYFAADGSDENDHTVSYTLELTYDDWCAAEMARELGFEEDYKLLSGRAKNYRHVFDPQTGFVRRKNAEGQFVEPFNPNDSHKRGFCECSPWEYTTLVPHDIQGVINLMGGDKRMVEHIDGAFKNNRFNHINETAFHIPFIYNFARAPHRTMEICRLYMPTVHSLEPGGLYGEDDAGAMSSWFAFIMLGLFPSCPARPCYSLTSPAFKKWTLRLPGGKSFTVDAKNNSERNIYIQSAKLNGESYDKSYLDHGDIMAGGTLELVMGPAPSRWATAFDSAPPSDTKEAPAFEVLSVSAPPSVRAGARAFARVNLVNRGADGSFVCEVFENGLFRGSAVCTLSRGETGEFAVPFTAYGADTREITVGGAAHALRVDFPKPPDFFFGPTESDFVMLPAGDTEREFTVSARVKNTGSSAVTRLVTCALDGAVTETRPVTLRAGEEIAVAFTVKPWAPGSHYARVGRGRPVQIDVAARPDESKWIMWRGCKAEFGQAGDNLYINAAGKQHQYTNDRSNHMHYGILFARHKAEGDFDAAVRVEYEAYTTPYALHGIIVKNTLDTLWDDADGTVFCGAMSSRGFMCMQYGGALDKDTPRASLGGPEAPYWFKVEKRGDHFNCYYSEDERQTWKKHMGVTMARAAREQYVGLAVNSCTPDLRLVKFTDFEIVLVRP